MKSKLSLLVLAFLTACGGGGGGSSAPTTPFPSVTVTASSTKIFTGDPVKISWSSTNATTCNAVEGFSGVQPISGETNFTPTKAGTYRYALSCTGDGRTGTNAVIVFVEDAIQTFSGAQSAALVSNSNPDGNFVTSKGIFAFNTGAWGQKSASSFSFDMTGSVDVRNSVLSIVRFNWEAVPSATPGIVAFNNVYVGKRPGATTSTTDKFPVQISKMPNVTVTGNISSICLTVCGFGTIVDLFVMDNAQQVKDEVGTEIIIGTEHSSGIPGPGTPGFAGVVRIDGVDFNVYRNPIVGTPWKTILYFPLTPINKLSLNMKNFIDDSISRGYLAPTSYLQGVEIGVEVGFGKGYTEITNFKID